MNSRISLPSTEGMSDGQLAIHRDIVRTRGNVQGPFLAWLLSPGLAAPAQQLGAFCRYGTELSLEESEMLILCVAGHHDCAGEQEIHEPIALDAGLSPLVIAQLRAGELPDLSSPRLKLLYRFAAELLSTHTVSDALFGEARTIFSEKQLVEVVGLVGYYSLVAYTLNAFGLRSAG